MKTGKVKWFNNEKGYGFILSDDDGKDVFVHKTALQEANLSHLNDGQKISFDLSERNGRVSAINLKLI